MGKKDRQDCPGSEVERKALWERKKAPGRHQEAARWFGKKIEVLKYRKNSFLMNRTGLG